MREYIRPARPVRSTCVNTFALHAEKCPNRVFSRVPGEFCAGWGCAVRVLCRVWCWWGCAGRVLYRVWCWWGCAGRVFRGTAAGRTAVGESFRGRAAARSHRERVYGRPQSLWPSLISWGTTFACTSPQGISSYEIESLKFCRFCAVVYAGSAGIACDFWRAGEVCSDRWPRDGMRPERAALTHAATYGGERRVRHGTLRLTAAGRRARPQRMAGAPCSSVTMR